MSRSRKHTRLAARKTAKVKIDFILLSPYFKNQTKNIIISTRTALKSTGPAMPESLFSCISYPLLLTISKICATSLIMKFQKQNIVDLVIGIGLAVNVFVIIAILIFYFSK